MRLRLFISYARRDKPLVLPLASQLGAKYDCWIDWEDIPDGAEWEKEISKGIAQSDVFLFLMTPNSVASEWCNKELQIASNWGKRIIPIVFGEPPTNTPEICRRLQYCFPEQQSSLHTILERRREEARLHSDLLVQALRWEAKSKPDDLLLKGWKLKQAVSWLKTSDDQPPAPTHLHREFILSSQVAERNVLAIASTSLVGFFAIGSALLVGFDIERRSSGFQYSFHGSRVQSVIQTVLAASGVAGVGVLGLKGRELN